VERDFNQKRKYMITSTSQEINKNEDTISSRRRVMSVVGIIVFFGCLALIACAFCCK